MAPTTLRAALGERLSPERTRKPTWIERRTVCRLSWDGLVRLNRWKAVVESAANNGKPVRGALVLAIILSALLFVAAHSIVG